MFAFKWNQKCQVNCQPLFFFSTFSHEEVLFTFRVIVSAFWNPLDSSKSFGSWAPAWSFLQESRFPLSGPGARSFQAVGFTFPEFQPGPKNVPSTFESMMAQMWPVTHSDYSLPSLHGWTLSLSSWKLSGAWRESTSRAECPMENELITELPGIPAGWGA